MASDPALRDHSINRTWHGRTHVRPKGQVVPHSSGQLRRSLEFKTMEAGSGMKRRVVDCATPAAVDAMAMAFVASGVYCPKPTELLLAIRVPMGRTAAFLAANELGAKFKLLQRPLFGSEALPGSDLHCRSGRLLCHVGFWADHGHQKTSNKLFEWSCSVGRPRPAGAAASRLAARLHR